MRLRFLPKPIRRNRSHSFASLVPSRLNQRRAHRILGGPYTSGFGGPSFCNDSARLVLPVGHEHKPGDELHDILRCYVKMPGVIVNERLTSTSWSQDPRWPKLSNKYKVCECGSAMHRTQWFSGLGR